MRSDTGFDFVLATLISIGGLATGIACIVGGTTYGDMSWTLLPVAALILFFSIRVLSVFPKDLFERIKGDISVRQEVIIELSLWLAVIIISVCIRMFP
ncbi:MAG: hypothetical protein QNI95_12820 [Desulfobacterales bacterium]|nr:hypothetical protein [Desulfobacterales bacterium]